MTGTERDVTIVMSIASSDSSGADGVQADLRAFAAAGVHGTCAVSMLSAQGTRGVRKVSPLPPDLVRAQIETVLDDLQPRAVKTGALGNATTVEIIADALRDRKNLALVVDPVVNPTRGRALTDDAGVATLARELIPMATLVTPNRDETSRLAGRARGLDDARRACRTIVDLGAKAVLIKGGHFTGNDAIDLFYDGKDFCELRAPRRDLPTMLGLGSTLSALITAFLAKGEPVLDAVRRAHGALQRALEAPRRLSDNVYIVGDLDEAVANAAPTVVTVRNPTLVPIAPVATTSAVADERSNIA
jgi:hydroxymethylpyrimidine/phosphomethylpyrimidine kinase